MGDTVTLAAGPERPSLQSYHLLPGVPADLPVKLGRHEEARVEFERPTELTDTVRERDLSMERARRKSRPTATD